MGVEAKDRLMVSLDEEAIGADRTIGRADRREKEDVREAIVAMERERLIVS
jgi:hypothetical protein